MGTAAAANNNTSRNAIAAIDKINTRVSKSEANKTNVNKLQKHINKTRKNRNSIGFDGEQKLTTV